MTPEETLSEKARYEKIAENTENHHWVPQFYLGFFARPNDPKRVYKYQFNQQTRPVGKGDIASAKDLYTFEELSGGKTRVIEGIFAEHEGRAHTVIQEIILNEALPKTESAASELATFVSILKTRGPSFTDWLKNMETEQIKLYNSVLANNPEQLKERMKKAGVTITDNDEFEEVQKFMLNPDQYTIEMEGGATYYFKIAFEISKDIYEILVMRKSWHLLVAPDNRHFITSDNPVIIQEPEEMALEFVDGIEHGTILLTLSPKFCLAFRSIPLKTEKVLLNRADVDGINASIADVARLQLYSHIASKDLEKLCSVDRSGNDSKVTVTKIAPFAPYYKTEGAQLRKEVAGLRENSVTFNRFSKK